MLTIIGDAISMSTIDDELTSKLRDDSYCFTSVSTSFKGFLLQILIQQHTTAIRINMVIIKQTPSVTPTAMPITLLLF